jgi:type IV secretion system protein VirB9
MTLPMLRGLLLLAMGTWLAAAAPQACAQAITQYDYAPDRIYPVRTGLGITTQIELSPYEKVIDYSTGFSNGWDLDRRDNVFYLKPKNVDVDTNLLVRTQTHSYIFELKVVATDWRQLDQAKLAGVQYKVSFRYPADTEFASKAQAEPGPQLETALDPRRSYDFDYDYATHTHRAWLVPATVYDDGRFTYIRMSNLSRFPSGDFPAVFARDRRDGEDFVVNTTIQDNTIVVHGTYPYLVIRHGRDTVGLRRNPPK